MSKYFGLRHGCIPTSRDMDRHRLTDFPRTRKPIHEYDEKDVGFSLDESGQLVFVVSGAGEAPRGSVVRPDLRVPMRDDGTTTVISSGTRREESAPSVIRQRRTFVKVAKDTQRSECVNIEKQVRYPFDVPKGPVSREEREHHVRRFKRIAAETFAKQTGLDHIHPEARDVVWDASTEERNARTVAVIYECTVGGELKYRLRPVRKSAARIAEEKKTLPLVTPVGAASLLVDMIHTEQERPSVARKALTALLHNGKLAAKMVYDYLHGTLFHKIRTAVYSWTTTVSELKQDVTLYKMLKASARGNMHNLFNYITNAKPAEFEKFCISCRAVGHAVLTHELRTSSKYLDFDRRVAALKSKRASRKGSSPLSGL